MARIIGSLLFRVAAILVLGLCALQLTILIVAIWPDGRPTMFRLVDPGDAREIVEAIEDAPIRLRPSIIAATSMGGTQVSVLPDMPVPDGDAGPMRKAPRLDARFRRFADQLEGRDFMIQVRRDRNFPFHAPGVDAPAGPMRLLIRLKTGDVLAIERKSLVLRQLYARYGIVAAVATLMVGTVLAMLWWQVIRPLARLSHAARSIREETGSSDLRMTGAREIRALSASLNDMKHRIVGLLADRTRMLAAIAHDLRTYLTRLRLRAEFIDDARQKERAVADLDEMAQLLDDILLFASADAAPGVLPPRIDARTEVSSYVHMRQECGDAVCFEDLDRELFCRCSPLALRRILANLVDNALRYGGTAEIRLSARGDHLELAVSDDGPGIPENLIDELSQPFTRGEASRGRHSGGAGLGLSIVKALAQSHGGQLKLANRHPHGLCVTVLLPA